MTEIDAQMSIMDASPKVVAKGANVDAPISAPAFPHAALMPFKVDLHAGEYVRDGIANVVALGPKLAKKKVRPYRIRSRYLWLVN